jgi:cation:H+ antiporter
MVEYLILAVAMGALIYGAELLIVQSEKIAFHFNISPFVVGASLIALGTSLPELAASMQASFLGKSELAVSNVLGSNIFNIALVLGAVFLFAKRVVPERDLFQEDAAWLFIPIFIFVLTIFDGVINRAEGVILLFIMVAYLLFLIQSDTDLTEDLEEEDKEKFNWFKSIPFLIAGFALVVYGAQFTIDSAANIARSFGVSEWIIGLLLLAFGTSLPELVVSIKAALKGNAEMALGNIIGSNLSNIAVVLGASSLINPLRINLEMAMFDIVAMVGITLLFIFILANRLYSKSTGILFLAITSLVIMNAFG